MGERVAIPGGDAEAYLAGGVGPPVVVLQEYWGVVPQICGLADRLAAEGFRVAVPDLYDGVATDDRAVAHDRMMRMDVDAALATVDATAAWMTADSEPGQLVGGVGFCMGGGLALLAGARLSRIGAAVVFYGFLPWPGTTFAPGSGPATFQLHFADDDPYAPPALGDEFARAVEDAGGSVEHWRYRAGHAFMDETRPESHDPESASRAWTRTLDFLRGALTSTSEEP